MDSARWRVVKEVFQAALDRPAGERSAYLQGTCGADTSLRLEVESLLAAYTEADDAIERAAAGFPRQMLDAPLTGSVPAGGSARIASSARSDTGEWAPYFVMEYIEGQSITEYCAAHSLKTVDRLKLFRHVCAAVHYAHRNRVVHRDIKPGNIQVTSDGVPKLLDFGVAKILGPEVSASSHTQPTVGLMTPDYASPEQIRAEPITVASVVYSLGVLLFELLTGHRPYRVESGRPADLAHAICEEQPERPSTVVGRVDPEKLRRRLSGDLDTIVLMALRKEPARRYQSVSTDHRGAACARSEGCAVLLRPGPHVDPLGRSHARTVSRRESRSIAQVRSLQYGAAAQRAGADNGSARRPRSRHHGG